MPFSATWMDPEIVSQSEVSQKEKDKQCIISLICGIWKNGSDVLICKAEIESQMQKTNGYVENLWLPRGEWGENELGDWD